MSEKILRKLVVFTMGGKGGVGKTGLMCALIDWFIANLISHRALDLDMENKATGSLSHFYRGQVPKINIFTPAGLDAFIDYLDEGAPIILADMGAGSGSVTHDWFDTMHDAVAAAGIRFTAIGVITDDPASVDSVLTWAERLQERVNYLIVENFVTRHSNLQHWRTAKQAISFRQMFHPQIMTMANRIPDFENACRNHGITVSQVVEPGAELPVELRRSVFLMRAQAARSQLFSEFERVKEVLLP